MAATSRVTRDADVLVDDDRIGPLYREHIDDAMRLGFLLSGDAATAQDLAHDAFLRAASRLGSLRDPERFRPYLRRAVVRQLLQRRRSEGRELARIDRVAGRAAPPDELANAAMRLDLVSALWTLPVRQRAAVVLRYWHDLPESEIADTLGCRPGTVKSNLARGLAALRQEVEPR